MTAQTKGTNMNLMHRYGKMQLLEYYLCSLLLLSNVRKCNLCNQCDKLHSTLNSEFGQQICFDLINQNQLSKNSGQFINPNRKLDHSLYFTELSINLLRYLKLQSYWSWLCQDRNLRFRSSHAKMSYLMNFNLFDQ